MAILLIENSNKVIRIREEECGCVFFFDSVYVEGDHQTYFILKQIAEGKTIREVVDFLMTKFDVDRETLLNDLINLFIQFEPYELFQDYVAELNRLREGKKNESA